jgi:hypothetical protein
MRRVGTMAVIWIVILANCARADDPATSRPANAAEYANRVQPDGEKPICEQRAVTGSRITKTVCWTPSQRAQAQADGRKQAEDTQRNAATTCTPSLCQDPGAGH